MKKQIFNCFVFICFISCQNKELLENPVTIKIINEQVNSVKDTSIFNRMKLMYNDKERNDAKNIITYKLTNTSKYNYLFVLDEDLIEVTNQYDLNTCSYCKKGKIFYNIETNSNAKPEYVLNRGDSFTKSNDKLNPEIYRIEENRYKLNELNYSSANNDFDFSNSIRKNSFVLYPNQSKYFQTVIYLPLKEANIYDNSISYFIFKNKIKYDFNLIYISDSTQIKKNLPEFELKELQENYVKIFHGKVFSNKIPIKFID